MPRLAIIISALGEVDLLEGTLLSVLENRPADCEIIVALNQAYSDPYDLKDEVRFVQAGRRVSAISAINQALASARAPFVHLLASGCEVTEGWADEALSRFGDRQVASVAPLVYDRDARDRIFAAGVGYRRGGKRFLVGHGLEQATPEVQGSIVGPSTFAAFYRKAAIDFVGGLSSRLGPRQADIDLALVLKHAGFTTILERRSQVFASTRVDSRVGALGESLYSERLFWRNLGGAGLAGSLAAHAGLVAIELLASFGRPRMVTQAAARAWACCQIGGYVRHRHALGELRRRAVSPKAPREHVRVDRSHQGAAQAEAAMRHAPSR